MCLSLLGSSRRPNQECCMRTDEGRQRVEEPFALIPDVGNVGRECGSASNILWFYKPYVQVMEDTQRERERVREYKLVIIRDITTITITIATTLTKAYKVTLYSDCLRATSLYNIYRNVLNLGCPRDSVNTAIIQSYSTRFTSQCNRVRLPSNYGRHSQILTRRRSLP